MFNIIPIPLACTSPYVRYVNNYAPNWSYTESMRILYDFELLYVVDGWCNILYDNISYPLSKGDLFYFKPGVSNQMSVDASSGFHTHCIHFDWLPPAPEYDFSADDIYIHPTLSESYCLQIDTLKKRPLSEPSDFSIPTHLKNTPAELCELFGRCYYAFIKNDAVSRLKLRADFLSILAFIASHIQTNDSSNPGDASVHPLIRKAIDYIQINYHEPLTVASLADYCGLSEKYFGKLFKNNIGHSVNTFLLSHRIKTAKKLLVSSDFSIEEIALKIGFDNVYYFSNCFKKQTGYTPSFYRKHARVR